MTDLSDLMRDLATRLDDIEDRIADLCEAGDVLLAIELFAEYDGLRTAMGRRTDDLARTIADAMPDRRIEVPGVGVVERRTGKERRAWDWPALLPLVTRRYLDPEQTGEFPTDPMVAVDRMRQMVEDVIGVTPSKGPKITPLRKWNIDPDEFSESKPGRVSLQITRNEAS
jgi:hypothetical protein